MSDPGRELTTPLHRMGVDTCYPRFLATHQRKNSQRHDQSTYFPRKRLIHNGLPIRQDTTEETPDINKPIPTISTSGVFVRHRQCRWYANTRGMA
jgi:hypothetical protein